MYLNRNRIFFLWGIVECVSILLVLLFLSGCVREESSEDAPAGIGVLRFSLFTASSHDVSTRVIDESAINDLYLLVYDASHQLLKKEYYSSPLASPSDLTLSVRSGSGYTVYGIANTGNESLFSDVSVINTEEKLKAFTTGALSSWNDIDSGSYMLMSGSVVGVTVLASSSNASAPTSTCSLSLKRLAAKVTLNVGITAGSGVTITGYRVYGIPKKSYYIAHPLSTEENSDGVDEQPTRAQDACLPAGAGDWTDSGVLTPTSGTSINTTFYMYENRPGVNTDIALQKGKVKEAVPGTPADSAAYVVIYGNAPGYISLSWKIYLGANATTNFNIKRNCTYTCTVTLKPNDSDVRINYNKLIWAGSNIYWDGTKLTFDATPVDLANPTTQELTNMQKQGVSFKWGSLVGISLSSSLVTYTPTYNSTTPSSSTWSIGSTTYANITYFTDNVAGDQTNAFLSDAAQNKDTNYLILKGDICQYLSKTQPSLGSWRMPTQQEFNAAGLADGASVSWTTSTAPWAEFGSFGDQTNNVNTQGTFLMPGGGTYTVNGASTSYPASGYRPIDGTLLNVGQGGYYWSCSASNTNGYTLSFDNSNVYPAANFNRQYAFAVRCVKN